MIGETLGSYTIVKRIGAGGMGEVFLAQHARIKRQAAIKVLLPELSSNKDMVERFFAEARATSSIQHPGIVDVLDCDAHASGRAYIVMELLRGESLAARLVRQPALDGDAAMALAVVGEIADAVGAAHAEGIVHRDIKPDNVFLMIDASRPLGWRAKVLDFGIAKLMGRDQDGRPASSRTRTGTLMGTPVYMSPEQCRGARQVDHRSDIYSLGCILFETLAGRPPFVYDGYGELISAHMNEAPPSVTSVRSDAFTGADALLDRMLAKSADDRLATMSDVYAAIAAILSGAGLERLPLRPPQPSPSAAELTRAPNQTGGGTSVLPTPASGGTRLLPTPVPGRPTTLSEQATEIGATGHRPRRVALVAGLATLAAAALGVALLVLRRPPPGTPPPPSVPQPAASAEPPKVTIEVSDAPDDVSVTVDGTPAQVPLTLPRSAELYTLVFSARGLRTRTLKVDASTTRTLTLAMQPEAEPPSETAPRATHETSVTPTESTAKKRHAPATRVENDARKL